MRVGYQGAPGAYSEAAAFAHFGGQVKAIPYESFEEVFDAVEGSSIERGLLPIENSLAGSIHRNYDLLMRHSLHIVGEEFLRVSHCLIGLPGASLEGIRRVISHPQALAQCERTLKAMDVEIEIGYDTAGSVEYISRQGDPSLGALASQQAAQVYGLEVLKAAIEDDPANYTRFLAVSKEPEEPVGNSKTSIVFSLENQPGAMFKALSAFALRDIDLTKLESRPLLGKPWEYLFYIDFAGSISEPKFRRALDHLSELAPLLRVLGSYPRKRPGVK